MDFFFSCGRWGRGFFFVSKTKLTQIIIKNNLYLFKKGGEKFTAYFLILLFLYYLHLYLENIFFFRTLLFFLCVVKQTHGFTSAYANVTKPFDTTRVLLYLSMNRLTKKWVDLYSIRNDSFSLVYIFFLEQS